MRLLTVSRIDPRKGLRLLPDAVARLVAAGRDVSLDLVGPPIGAIGEQERDAIRADAERLGVSDRVRLVGPVPLDRLLPLYRDYDLFVLPTMPGEGIPRVLMEAMAAGLPVVTTDVAGISSLISDGSNGLLVRDSTAPVDCCRHRPPARRLPLAAAVDRRRLRDGARPYPRAAGRRDDARGVGRSRADAGGGAGTGVKVCFVVPSLADGGAERVAVTVLSGLDGARYERTLYLFSGTGVYFDRVAPDVRIVTAARRSWLGRLMELAMFLRTARPDIVMPFLSYFITALAVTLSGSGARVIFNQGTPTSGFLDDPDFAWRQPWRRRVFAAMTRMFYRRADAVVVTSAGVADDLAANYRVPRAKIRILHNPVDLNAVVQSASEELDQPLDAGAPVIVAAGRLAGVKNYPLLIAAIAEVCRRTPVRAWILGDGAERASLEQQVRDERMEAVVSFLGFDRNPWRYIARADVFVLTSRYEGFGNVLIEAMACGTPVVATRSSGTSEIIEDEVNGLLVDHDAAAVAAAIVRLLHDRPLRTRLVAEAERRVQQYALPRVVERYERLFAEVAA